MLNCLQTKRISAKHFLVSSELCDAFLKQRKARLELTIGKPKQQVKNTEKYGKKKTFTHDAFINTLAK